MLSLPREEAGWELMGAPWPPQGPRGWSLLGVIASRGGAVMPNANDEERSEGSRGLCSPNPSLFWRGSRIKQQQKHHPLGDCGLHSLPSLRSGFCPPPPPHPHTRTHTHVPYSPLWLPQGPLHPGGTLWLARGSTVPRSWACTFPASDTPLGGGRGGRRACSG